MFNSFQIVEMKTTIVTEEEMMKEVQEIKKQKKTNLLNKLKLNGGK